MNIAASETASETLGPNGRMICGSKSYYYEKYPNHIVVFNANLCTKTHGKIWFGDIDVTLDEERLKELSSLLGEDIYVLQEMDARFDNEKKPRFDRAVVKVHKGLVIIGEN